MTSENEQHDWITDVPSVNNAYFQKVRLYETRSNFYMIGCSKNRSTWRVLKIDRSEPTELNITEDPTTYTKVECCELLKRIHDGNKSTGGLRFVYACYGIVGFIKFLGPYYMLLITKRRKIGVICGHAVYAITKSEILPIPNSTVQLSVAYSKNENRYKKLLCSVDLTKDFYFSYSYRVMHSFQNNLSTREPPNETMFVWNKFLTTPIQNQLRNNLWTVQLVYGYFKQVTLSIADKNFKLTLIARRSRHYAGTRYLKRGVNEKGRVANDVETEQIVFEDVPEGCPVQISSVVQNRGSIPLFWSQETSRLNIKPDIILSRKDQKYDATRLHFENLTKRYGNPIIILNLIKTKEKRPRESLLRMEFAHAIELINKDLPEENRLKFLHWDLNKYSRNKSTNVLALLGKVATYALNLTGFFYCHVIPNSKSQDHLNLSRDDYGDICDFQIDSNDTDNLKPVFSCKSNVENVNFSVKPIKHQTGILRTNCIDCLDRTNVAQYAYGWAALGRQLQSIGYIDTPVIELDSNLADDLMRIYERMGDTLALQYGGSAAHNKIFCQTRGQWKAATQSQEFFRTIQRYYSNAYMDAEKQDAINVFLGHYQPQIGRPALWELDSDQHYNVGGEGSNTFVERNRTIRRSLSVGNILYDGNILHDRSSIGTAKNNEDSLNEISGENDSSYIRFANTTSGPDLTFEEMPNSDRIFYNKDSFNCSNFLDVDWISSSGNSCEEETFERSTLVGSPIGSQSSEYMVNELCTFVSDSEISPSLQDGRSPVGGRFSDRFAEWVTNGDTFL
ncbi:phosphoinositide phosphatase SAC2-like isoform X2 [Rutidosis leptorrhynchoides]|uniref:phosphoinositide phosphatase SAC2-like isoform X2 n=1 Tax=Rutidosis leptorrhynchoides TaxID=125765 RepID=UPI003A9A334C